MVCEVLLETSERKTLLGTELGWEQEASRQAPSSPAPPRPSLTHTSARSRGCAHTPRARGHPLSSHTPPTKPNRSSAGRAPLSSLRSPAAGRRQSSGAEAAPASRPWFYPVVEQHDVTYHRVKPLAGHGETREQQPCPTASSSSTTKEEGEHEWQGGRGKPSTRPDTPGEPEGGTQGRRTDTGLSPLHLEAQPGATQHSPQGGGSYGLAATTSRHVRPGAQQLSRETPAPVSRAPGCGGGKRQPDPSPRGTGVGTWGLWRAPGGPPALPVQGTGWHNALKEFHPSQSSQFPAQTPLAPRREAGDPEPSRLTGRTPGRAQPRRQQPRTPALTWRCRRSPGPPLPA